MEIDSTNHEKAGIFTSWWSQLKGFPRKLKDKARNIAKNTKKIGKDDPRKIWHAAKVGLALTLVSFFYYNGPLYHSFEQPVMWAVLTVVVVFEFTTGATISKSINRGTATALAGVFGVGAKYLAGLLGNEGPDPIVLGVLVFIVGSVGTYTRFYPQIKRRYDYGTMIFVLTFSLVAVSSYRSEDILTVACERLATILIGVATVMTISMVIRPVWAGDDLHKLVCTNLEKLASFLDGFGSEYFHIYEIEGNGGGTKSNEKGFLEAFISVIGSKATEESLANFAWWEPPHGSFRISHPWKQYLKIGSLARECACHLVGLTGRLNSKSQVPTEFDRRTEEVCKRMITESSKVLKELALSIKTMTQPSSSFMEETHMRNAKSSIDDLKKTLGTSKTFFQNDESNVMDLVPAASVLSTLIDVTKCVHEISKAVEELSVKADFKKKKDSPSSSSSSPPPPWSQLLHRGIVNPVMEDDVESGDFIVIEIGENIESAEKVEIEEANPANNSLAAKKEESVVCEIHVVEEVKTEEKKRESVIIGVRESSAATTVEELKMAQKIMNFADITKLYDSTQFFEPVEIGVRGSTALVITTVMEDGIGGGESIPWRKGSSEIDNCK
ncbi:aluminum-activated malate transporter 8-like [Nicotiana tabacum]|uniref:Aluminum-activated malate transporter 8-like n=2 Tax=Nicotiana TaxID=4085 RepID=A0A1S4ACT9_TOBAC|nr:PREDICTED: aluminum-activated malate transporter 8-like [Nicotiana sylvestris]XP_016474426.1 PREDICTED: aluminum-activated malate transporter 8-like [Nicotiana tabacum]